MSSSVTNQFYVYVYLDPRKPGKYKYDEFEFDFETFYVGKGENNRINIHLNEYILENDPNKMKTNKIKKIIRETSKEPIRIFYKENMFEQDAFDLETLMIKTIGRKDLGTGPLTNMTNGGDGVRNLSQETKRRMSKAKKGIPLSEDHRRKIIECLTGRHPSMETRQKLSIVKSGKNNPNFGKHPTEETRQKLRVARIGKRLSEETRKRMSDAERGEKNHRNKYHFYCSDGKDYWKDFTKNERHAIVNKFRKEKADNINYKGITITKKLKEKLNEINL